MPPPRTTFPVPAGAIDLAHRPDYALLGTTHTGYNIIKAKFTSFIPYWRSTPSTLTDDQLYGIGTHPLLVPASHSPQKGKKESYAEVLEGFDWGDVWEQNWASGDPTNKFKIVWIIRNRVRDSPTGREAFRVVAERNGRSLRRADLGGVARTDGMGQEGQRGGWSEGSREGFSWSAAGRSVVAGAQAGGDQDPNRYLNELIEWLNGPEYKALNGL